MSFESNKAVVSPKTPALTHSVKARFEVTVTKTHPRTETLITAILQVIAGNVGCKEMSEA